MKVSDIRAIVEEICQQDGLSLEAGSITFAWNRSPNGEKLIIRLRPPFAPWKIIEETGGTLERAIKIAIIAIRKCRQ